MSDFQGKVALITGGGKGLGRITARLFVEQGATVIVNYFHSPEAAQRTQLELAKLGGRVHLIRASVAKQAQVDRMFDEIGELVGGIDILVNNAASGALVPFEQLDERQWQRAFDTNVKGALWCSQRAARMMAARGGGSIVNVSSIGAGMVLGNYLGVGTSKAALESLTRYLAVQLAPDNIRVNTASCCLIDGDGAAKFFPQASELRQVIVAATPLGRVATEAEFANVVLFLASEASSWITGQTILADGGLSLGSAILSPPSDERVPKTAPAFVRHGQPAPSVEAEPEAAESPAFPSNASVGAHTDPVEQDGVDADRTIVVVGMGLVVPGADTPEKFWQLRLRGDVMFSEPGPRWDLDSYYSADPSAEDLSYARTAGYITDPAQQPADPTADYTTFWLRRALRQAIDGVATRDDDRWTFAVGFTADGSQHLEEALVAIGVRRRLGDLIPHRRIELDDLIRQCFPRCGDKPADYLPHMVGRRAMEGLLPEGTKPVMVDTACSSSLYAIDIGIKSLRAGTSEVAACGGAFGLGPRGSTLFSKLEGLSKSGHVRSLDKGSDGVLFSDGAAVVVLKTLRRAREDGDRILGVLAGLGTSSDGKGKAIYAPNANGQQVAVQRALSASGTAAADIDWVVAHATGTPAGDLAELESLRSVLASGGTTYVTSNKSLIGHTGWAAGAVSLIEVLLAFQHQQIPPQHEFSEAPAEFGLAETNLEIPRDPKPWPAAPRRRTAAVSAFGFGGTNAHLIVGDRAIASDAAGVPEPEPIAVVGWSAALPGDPSPSEVAAWLRGDGVAPKATYGDHYPLPAPGEVRIPPPTLRLIDRCQMMILKCVAQLSPQVRAVASATRDTTGVVVGHLGPTRNAVLYALRCSVNHLRRAVARHPGLAEDPTVREALDSFQASVASLVPAANENSYPGIMPNIIPARVANYHDFHGPNVTVDTGFYGGLSAVQLAADYIRWGEMDLALVCGINGNSTPELREILRGAIGADTELGEGAFLAVLARESLARAQGLPVLGLISEETGVGAAEIRCDPRRADLSYLAGDGVRALIQALMSAKPSVTVFSSDPLTGNSTSISVCAPPAPAAQTPQASRPMAVQRHTVHLEPQPIHVVRQPGPAVDTETMVLTDDAGLARQLAHSGGMVICVAENRPDTNGDGVLSVADIDGTTFDRWPGGWRERTRRLCVISRLDDPTLGVTEQTLRLHDAVFLALQALHRQLVAERGSFVILLLSAVAKGVPHPATGLFTGLLKSAARELPGLRSYAVLTDADQLNAGLAQLAAESAAYHSLPVVVYCGDQRQIFVAVAAAEDDGERLQLDRSSTIVALGGGRGVTAECLVAVAAQSSAKIWVLGSNPLDSYPPDTYTDADDVFARRRPDFIRDGLRSDPGMSVALLNRRFERMAQARETWRNLGRMAAHSGKDRVQYLVCDVTDADSVAQALRRIHDEDGRIDLLVNGAGLNRGHALAEKDFDEFRRVRDIKVRGYTNVKRALANANIPAPAVWCNFGSLVGFVGLEGELDYAAGNDFLASAACFASAAEGRDELTIGWTLWGDVGLAANNGITKAFMQHIGSTAMDTAEGVHHFLNELWCAHRWPYVVYLGDKERASLNAAMSGLLRPATQPARRAQPPYFLATRLVDEPDRIVAERTLTLATDGYVADHLVNGIPTLPGSFAVAIVAEAALALAPGCRLAAITDLTFDKFLRFYSGRSATTFRIVAEKAPGGRDDTAVAVRVLSDVRAPDGRLLQRDRLHVQATAHLLRNLPCPPVSSLPATTCETAAVDPYHIANGAVYLAGSLVSTTRTRVHNGGARAEFYLPVERRHEAFARLCVPAVLLDGLMRLAVASSERFVPLAAPTRIGRIDFYDTRNDVELAEEFDDRVQLYSTRWIDDQVEELAAVAPDSRLLVKISRLRGVVFGYIDTETRDFLTPAQMARRAAGGVPEAV